MITGLPIEGKHDPLRFSSWRGAHLRKAEKPSTCVGRRHFDGRPDRKLLARELTPVLLNLSSEGKRGSGPRCEGVKKPFPNSSFRSGPPPRRATRRGNSICRRGMSDLR
jgi:hypothetical protein